MESKMPVAAGPLPGSDRLASIDTMRGFAVLGILVMNIQSFAMPGAAYFNPTAFGDLTGVNLMVWVAGHLLADQKFMTIFSLLFGVGIVLMSERAEANGRNPAALHYRRMFWLLVIGVVHAYLFWYGEILTVYALCGLIVYLFRKRSVRTLIILGVVMLIIGSGLYLMSGYSMPHWPEADRVAFVEDWSPSQETIDEELEIYRGPWADQQPHRTSHSLEMHTLVFFIWGFWRAGGLMLLGMAMYKAGIFRSGRMTRFPMVTMALALLMGWPLVAWGMRTMFTSGWNVEYTFFLGSQYNYWGSILVSLGYMGFLYWLGERLDWSGFTRRLAAVGRMALTNYLVHTILCTLIFYGQGFGLFGSVERWGQALIVIAIWALQLWYSPLWLARFRFGPFEWLWRSLTYWKLQPFRRS